MRGASRLEHAVAELLELQPAEVFQRVRDATHAA
jgi:hypothetical protein